MYANIYFSSHLTSRFRFDLCKLLEFLVLIHLTINCPEPRLFHSNRNYIDRNSCHTFNKTTRTAQANERNRYNIIDLVWKKNWVKEISVPLGFEQKFGGKSVGRLQSNILHIPYIPSKCTAQKFVNY